MTRYPVFRFEFQYHRNPPAKDAFVHVENIAALNLDAALDEVKLEWPGEGLEILSIKKMDISVMV